MKTKLTRGAIDSFALATITLLQIPLLLFGFSPVYLLTIHILLSFSYYIIKNRDKKESIYGVLMWPVATLILSVPFQLFFFINPLEIVYFMFSIPGSILFLFTVLAVAASFIVTNVIFGTEKEKNTSEF